MQKIVIVKSMNVTPEDEVNERIAPFLEDGYRIISAQTSIALHGNFEKYDAPGTLLFDIAKHVYYVTTVVLEK